MGISGVVWHNMLIFWPCPFDCNFEQRKKNKKNDSQFGLARLTAIFDGFGLATLFCEPTQVLVRDLSTGCDMVCHLFGVVSFPTKFATGRVKLLHIASFTCAASLHEMWLVRNCCRNCFLAVVEHVLEH